MSARPHGRRRWVALLVVSLVSAAACAESSGGDPAQDAGAPVIAAVGDIACNSLPSAHEKRCGYDRVADVLRGWSSTRSSRWATSST